MCKDFKDFVGRIFNSMPLFIKIIIFTTIFLSIGFHSVSCTYKSKEDNWLYRSNISFNYKKDQVTRFTMRL